MNRGVTDGAIPRGAPAMGIAVSPPQAESLAGLAADARQRIDALARLESRVIDLERQLARQDTSNPGMAPSDDGSVEDGLSGAADPPIATKASQYYEPRTLECHIEQTVWDCPVIIGLPAIGKGSSAALFMSLLLNTMLQMYICYILISSPRFTTLHPMRSLATYSHRWRIQVAHEASQLDASGSSLVSRVCGGDKSLTVAAAHVNVLGDINAYLSLDAGGLKSTAFGGLGIGPLLCSVCIMVFVVMVLRELRVLSTQLFALASVQRGPTKVVDYTIVSVSRKRMVFVVIVGIVRATIAIVLLYAGTVWLAATTSITDLILNCAALGFVLELDERIHETIVPAWVHSFVGQLKPIPYRRPPKSMDAAVPFVSMVVLMTLSISQLLMPNVNDMINVKKALCGGNLDFVIKQNDAGFVLTRATVPYSADTDVTVFDPRARLRTMAVEELLPLQLQNDNVTFVPQFSLRKVSREEFESDADLPIRDWADWALCADMDTAYNGRWLQDMPAYFVAIRETTGLHRGQSLQETPWNCSDYAAAGFCRNHSMLRLFCPISCGCTDPMSGLLFGQTSQGCPAQCMPLLQEASVNRPCDDIDKEDEKWKRYWQEYGDFATRMVPQLHGVYQNYTAHKIAVGCNESSPDPLPGTQMCDDRHPFMVRRGLRSIAPFCPRKCCTGPEPDPFCPRSCPRNWTKQMPAWKKMLAQTR